MITLVRKWRKAKEAFPASQKQLSDMEATLRKVDLALWEKDERDAQRLRYTKSKSMDIYDCSVSKGMRNAAFDADKMRAEHASTVLAPGKNEIQLSLTQTEAARGITRGAASWISSGIRLQEQQ